MAAEGCAAQPPLGGLASLVAPAPMATTLQFTSSGRGDGGGGQEATPAAAGVGR